MSKEFKYISAQSKTRGEIRLDGTFGEQINGAAVAAEIYYLDKIVGVKEIHLYFNSVGGKVYDSMSIVSAILNAGAETHGHNDGLCMSSAFHSFISCDVLHAYDYSRFMYHSPSSPDGESEALEQIRSSMVTLIANRLNKKEDEVSSMLETEKFIKAKDFEKTFGLSIDIKSSARKPSITASMTIEDVVAEYTNFNNKHKSKMPEFDINSVLAKLNLREDIANPVAKVEAKIDEILATNASLTASNKKLKEDNEKMENELKTFSEAKAKAYVDELVAEGLIKEDAVDSVLTAYKANPEAVKAAFDAIPAPSASATIVDKTLDRKSDTGKIVMEYVDKEKKEPKDWAWYSKNASAELKEMKYSNPDKFKFLQNEYLKQ